MYHTFRSLYDRSLGKTPEQVFINSLKSEFELSPAESSGVLELAKSGNRRAKGTRLGAQNEPTLGQI